jgi:hypothetical protein
MSGSSRFDSGVGVDIVAALHQHRHSGRGAEPLVFCLQPAVNLLTTELTGPSAALSVSASYWSASAPRSSTDLREVFELHAAGKAKVIREIRPLDQVNESIADLEAWRVAARIVFQP